MMQYSTLVSEQQQSQTDLRQPYSITQQSQTDLQQPHSTPQRRNDSNLSFANVFDIEANRRTTSRTNNGTGNQIQFISELLPMILCLTCALIILCIIFIIPILSIAIGASYRDQCTINPNIPVYLIVSGVCGITNMVLLIVLVGVSICRVKQGSPPASILDESVIHVISIFAFFMNLFMFIWFIVGCTWIFGSKKNVVYDDIHSSNYCHRTLYDFAFVILIISCIMNALSFCIHTYPHILQLKKRLDDN